MLRRGSAEKITLAGPVIRKPYDVNMFLANDDNKKQLCQLLLRVRAGQQAVSRLEKYRDGSADRRRESPSTRLIEGQSDWKVSIIIIITA